MFSFINIYEFMNCKVVGGNLKLVMRKASWDPQIDEELMSDAATLNLLYVQTVAEVERGWVRADAETKRTLARMQARGAKKEVGWRGNCYVCNFGEKSMCLTEITKISRRILIFFLMSNE